MSPVFVILVLLGALFVWIGVAFLFPVIGGFVKDYFEAMKGVMDEDEDE